MKKLAIITGLFLVLVVSGGFFNPPMFFPVASVVYAVWSTTNTSTAPGKESGWTITESNLKATSGVALQSAATANTGKSSGKWYWEITVNVYNALAVGVIKSGDAIDSPTHYLGATANGYSYYRGGTKYNNGSSSAYGSSYTNGDIISVALDMDNGKVWFAKNGTWQNSGDPAAGTNAAFTGLSGTFYPAVGDLDITSSCQATANFGASAFTYSVPSGFNSGFY